MVFTDLQHYRDHRAQLHTSDNLTKRNRRFATNSNVHKVITTTVTSPAQGQNTAIAHGLRTPCGRRTSPGHLAAFRTLLLFDLARDLRELFSVLSMRWAWPINVQEYNICSLSRISGICLKSTQTYAKHCAFSIVFPIVGMLSRRNCVVWESFRQYANTGEYSETPSPVNLTSPCPLLPRSLI